MRKNYFIGRLSVFARVLTVTLCAAAALPADAQIIPASYPETFAASAAPGIYTLNCDVIQTSSGGELKAIAWDDAAGVNVQVSDYSSGTVLLNIPTVPEAVPDVALADDMNSPGDYVLALVYLDPNQKAIFELYHIQNVGSGLTVTGPFDSEVLSTNKARFPHIDLFADINNQPNGYPSMHNYIVSWCESQSGGWNMLAQYGDIDPAASIPISVLNNYTITTTGFCPDGDVAASTDLNGIRYADFAVNVSNTFSLQHARQQLTGGSTFTSATIYTGPGPNIVQLPRIEAMGIYDPSTTNPPWVIAASVYNPSYSHFECVEFNNAGSFSCSAPYLTGSENLCPAVGCGLGIPGDICSDNYIVGWHGREYITRMVDATTGNFNPAFNNLYIANMYPTSFVWGKVPIAISGCSNTGKMQLVAWFDGSGSIWYKLQNTLGQYRSTSVASIGTAQQYALYPNPATDKLNVNGVTNATYEIVGINGQSLGSGQLTAAQNGIDIKAIVSGTYLLRLTENGKQQSVKFVK